MNRADILTTAHTTITVDRAATYGSAENTFGRIAAFWSAHLDHPVTAGDVAVMMVLFKAARINGNPGHLDSYVDLVGYAAIGGELAGAA